MWFWQASQECGGYGKAVATGTLLTWTASFSYTGWRRREWGERRKSKRCFPSRHVLVLILHRCQLGVTQLNSDTNYSELVSDSVGLRLQSHKSVSTSHTSWKHWVPRLPAPLSSLATKSRVPTTTLPRFSNLLGQLRSQESALLTVTSLS